MEQHFYIGTLKITFETEQEIPLAQYDRLFLKPVLPVQTNVYADLKWTDTLNTPEWETLYLKTAEFSLWRAGQAEYRLYFRRDQEPAIASCLSESGDCVHVSALKSEREAVWRSFRPWFNIHLERLLLKNQALILHSASIIYRGEAILFTAPSGTGKTTQTNLWHEYREGVSDLNGDRTVLQQSDSRWYACGFPVYGSIIRCAQAAVPIRAVVIIRQACKDCIRELSPAEKVLYLYSECTLMRPFQDDTEAAMELLGSLVNEVIVIGLDCTMERSAVDVLHQYLYKD